MKKTADEETNDAGTIKVKIPKGLMKRVNRYCEAHQLAVDAFVLDALTEKLQMVYKERRRKPRL